MTASSQRLHPLSFIFLIVGSLKGLVLPAAVVVLTARGGTWEVWALWLSIPMAGYGLYRYFTTRYAFADDELVIRTGLIFTNERHIRYARIQNIETVQNPLHRALRVVEVRVETGGGTEQEARLQVLSPDAVDEMRRRVFEGKQRTERRADSVAPDSAAGPVASAPRRGRVGDPASAPPTAESIASAPPAVGSATAAAPRVLVRLGLRDIVLFGLVQNRGGLVIAAVLGVLWEADVWDWDIGSSSNIRHLIGAAHDSGWFSSWNVAVAAALVGIFAAFLILVRILSVGWAIVRLYGFTLTHTGDELRTACGLFTKVHAVIPQQRIQLVTVRQAPLQRAFGRVEVRVQTAGGAKDASPSREWLAPVLRRDAVDALLADVVPGPGFDAMEWQPVDRRAAWREMRASLRIIALAALGAMWFAPGATAAGMAALALLAYFAARGRARSFAFAIASDRVAFRGGWLWHSASLARYAKVQAVAMGESPFDRRWRMASVSADTAGGGSYRVTIPYLPVERAHSVFAELGGRVEQTAFRW